MTVKGRPCPPLPQPNTICARLPRETQEMAFDQHDRAFAFFKGACRRGIYDNMKTAVVFIGKDRRYYRRFLLRMYSKLMAGASHYLQQSYARV